MDVTTAELIVALDANSNPRRARQAGHSLCVACFPLFFAIGVTIMPACSGAHPESLSGTAARRLGVSDGEPIPSAQIDSDRLPFQPCGSTDMR